MCGPGLGPVSNVAVSASLEVLSHPLSMPLVRHVHSKMARQCVNQSRCLAQLMLKERSLPPAKLALPAAVFLAELMRWGCNGVPACMLQLQTTLHARCRHLGESLTRCAGSLDRRLSLVAAVLRRSCLPLLGMPGQAALSPVCFNGQCGS